MKIIFALILNKVQQELFSEFYRSLVFTDSEKQRIADILYKGCNAFTKACLYEAFYEFKEIWNPDERNFEGLQYWLDPNNVGKIKFDLTFN
jgi:hypothetical protein